MDFNSINLNEIFSGSKQLIENLLLIEKHFATIREDLKQTAKEQEQLFKNISSKKSFTGSDQKEMERYIQKVADLINMNRKAEAEEKLANELRLKREAEQIKELAKREAQLKKINDETHKLFVQNQQLSALEIENLKALKDSAKQEEAIKKSMLKTQSEELKAKIKAEAAQKALNDGLRVETNTVENLQIKIKSLNALRLKTNIESEEYNKIIKEQANLQRKLNAENERVGREQGKVGQYSKAVMGGIGTVAAGFGIGLGIDGVIQMGKAITETTAMFEKYQAVLTNIVGKDLARTYLADIATFAAKTPFQISEVTDSFVKLSNRIDGFKFDPEVFTKLGDVAAALGKPFEQLNEAILDINNSERWKEIGIKAETAGDKVKLTFKGQTQEVKRTEEAVIGAIAKFGEMAGVAGTMGAISNTLTGKLSNMADSFDILANSIGSRFSPVIGNIIGSISEATLALSDFVKVDASEKVESEKIKLETLTRIVGTVNESLDVRKNALTELQNLFPGYFKNIDLEKTGVKGLTDEYEKLNKELVYKADFLRGQEQSKSLQADLKSAEDEYNRFIRIETLNQQFIEAKSAGLTEKADYIKKDLFELVKVFDNVLISKELTGTGLMTDQIKKSVESAKKELERLQGVAGKELEIAAPEKIMPKKDEVESEETRKKREAALERQRQKEEEYAKKLIEYNALISEGKKKTLEYDLAQNKEAWQKDLIEFEKYKFDLTKIDEVYRAKEENIRIEYYEREQLDALENAKLLAEINELNKAELLKIDLEYSQKKLETITDKESKEYKKQYAEVLKITRAYYTEVQNELDKSVFWKTASLRRETDEDIEHAERTIKNKKELENKKLEIRIKAAEEEKAILLKELQTVSEIDKEKRKSIMDTVEGIMLYLDEMKQKIGGGEEETLAQKIANALNITDKQYEDSISKLESFATQVVGVFAEMAQGEVDAANYAYEEQKKITAEKQAAYNKQVELYKAGANSNITAAKKELDEQKKIQKQKQDEAQKAQAEKERIQKLELIADSIKQASNIYTAVTNIYTKWSPVPGGIFAALGEIGILLGSLVGMYSNIKKLFEAPKFAKGVIDLQGEGTETSDSIPAYLSKGESVMTANETKKSKKILTGIRNGLITDQNYNEILQTKIDYEPKQSVINLSTENLEKLQKENNDLHKENIQFNQKKFVISQTGNNLIEIYMNGFTRKFTKP